MLSDLSKKNAITCIGPHFHAKANMQSEQAHHKNTNSLDSESDPFLVNAISYGPKFNAMQISPIKN